MAAAKQGHCPHLGGNVGPCVPGTAGGECVWNHPAIVAAQAQTHGRPSPVPEHLPMLSSSCLAPAVECVRALRRMRFYLARGRHGDLAEAVHAWAWANRHAGQVVAEGRRYGGLSRRATFVTARLVGDEWERLREALDHMVSV